MPGSNTLHIRELNARSVPAWRVTRYSSGLSCRRHYASLFTIFRSGVGFPSLARVRMSGHFSIGLCIKKRQLLLLVVDDVDLLVWTGEFQALANFDLLLLGIVPQAQYPFLLLLNFAMQLLVTHFVLVHLPPLVEQPRNSVRAAQRHERVNDSTQHN